MKLAINTNCLIGHPREVLPAIHVLGCRDVEISTNTCKDGFEPLNHVKEDLNANDMKCVCFSGGWTDLARGNHDHFHVQALAAQHLGAPYIRLFASNPRSEAEISWVNFSSLVDELSYLSFITATAGFPKVLIENEGGLTSSVELILQLINQGHSNFGLVFDPVNLLKPILMARADMALEEAAHAICTLHPWIKHVHLKDIDEYGEYCLLGDGIVPWKHILTQLQMVDYNGYVALEHVVGTRDHEEQLAENWRRAKELVACVQR